MLLLQPVVLPLLPVVVVLLLPVVVLLLLPVVVVLPPVVVLLLPVALVLLYLALQLQMPLQQPPEGAARLLLLLAQLVLVRLLPRHLLLLGGELRATAGHQEGGRPEAAPEPPPRRLLLLLLPLVLLLLSRRLHLLGVPLQSALQTPGWGASAAANAVAAGVAAAAAPLGRQALQRHCCPAGALMKMRCCVRLPMQETPRLVGAAVGQQPRQLMVTSQQQRPQLPQASRSEARLRGAPQPRAAPPSPALVQPPLPQAAWPLMNRPLPRGGPQHWLPQPLQRQQQVGPLSSEAVVPAAAVAASAAVEKPQANRRSQRFRLQQQQLQPQETQAGCPLHSAQETQ